jgi:hypothetical protein
MRASLSHAGEELTVFVRERLTPDLLSQSRYLRLLALRIAVFKPTKVVDFIWEEEARDWDAEKVREMRELTKQFELFADNSWRQTFKVIPKLPYSFSYPLRGCRRKEQRAASARLGGRRALLESRGCMVSAAGERSCAW